MLTDIIKEYNGCKLFSDTSALYYTAVQFIEEYRRAHDTTVAMWKRFEHLENTLDTASRSATVALTSRNFGAFAAILGISKNDGYALSFGTLLVFASLIAERYTKSANRHIENELEEIKKTRSHC